MAITINVTTNGGTTTQTVASGASIQLSPAAQVQIIVDGVVIDPATLESVVNPPDVTFTLPDGQQITLLNFVDLQGGAGGGLLDGTGALTVASTLEELTPPAAGPQGGDDEGGAADGDGNLSTFNQATISEFAEFGSGAGGAGPDLPPGSPPAGDEGDDFELIIALPAPPGEPPVVIVVPLVPTIPPETPETPTVDTPDPTLAVLLINEIGLPSNPTGVAFIELANQSGTAQTTAGNLLTVVGPGGSPVVIALPDATIPVGGKLVLREDGSFEVFDAAGGSVAAGTYTTPAWGLGTDTTEPIGVNLSFAGTEIDTFQANGIEFANGGWTSNTAGTAELAGTPFDTLFDLESFSGFSGDIDTVLSSLGLSRPLVSAEALGDVPNPHPDHPPETEVNDTGFSRVFGGADGTPSDTNSEADWTTSNTPTEGSDNAAPGDVNPQDGTSPDDFDPAQNAGTNDPIAGQTVLVGVATVLDGGEGVGGDSLVGGRGPDFLFGTPSSDAKEISAFFESVGGNDILAGGDHNDFLYGNTGADLLSGGVVTDTLIGGAGGADILVDFDDVGNSGTSAIYGGYGIFGDTDVLVGGNGEDLLLTRNPDEDLLIASDNGAFVSELISEGFFGGDLLVGDNIGELTRVGEPVNEVGGTGQEVTASITLPFGGISELSGLEEGDRDVIIAGGSSDVIFGDNLGISTFLDSAPSDSLLDLVEGGLSNPALSWTLMGLQSDLGWRHHTNSYGEADNIDAGGGNDLVFGQGGNDEILGGSGIDVIYGGAGDDWIDVGDGLVGDSVGSAKGGELVVGDDLAVGGSALPSVFLLTEAQLEDPITPPTPEVTGGNDVILGDYRGDTLIGDGIISVGPSDPFFDLVATNAIQTDAVPIGGGGPAIAGGNDLIIGNGGDDTILGDGLVELLSIFNPWVFSLPVEGFEVTDFPSEGGTALIGGNDTLYGGAGRDVIYGEGNLSTFEFDPGNGDWKYIDEFKILLSGAFDGNDTLYGGDNGDTLYGNGGNDTLYGDTGADTYYGNHGDDLLVYRISDGPGVNTIYGDSGFGNQNNEDTLLIVNDTDSPVLVKVQPSGDTVNGTEQVDVLVGNDVIAVVDEVEDIVFQAGDAGDTFLLYGDFGPTDVTPTTFIMYGGGGNDALYGGGLVSQHHILAYGDGGDDFLEGGAGGDELYGGSGDDTVAGDVGNNLIGIGEGEINGGSDTLYGGGGDDQLYGDAGRNLDAGDTELVAGSDTLYGADGDNQLYGDAGNDLIVDGGGMVQGGNDLLIGGSNNDALYGDAGRNLGARVDSGQDTLYGGGGDDQLHGDAGNDLIGSVESSRDLLYGGDGNDLLTGDAGGDFGSGSEGDRDTLYGGNGDDQIYGDAGRNLGIGGGSVFPGSDFLYGGEGDDQLYGDAGNDIFGGGEGGLAEGGDDFLYGGDGNDLLTGDAGGDLSGSAEGGNDTLYGDGGNDTLFGDAAGGDNGRGGDDTLFGGAGDDTLYGGSGIDRLSGGSGTDTLYGDDGEDTFAFDLAAGFDTDIVADFLVADDILEFSGTGVATIALLDGLATFDTTTNVGGGAAPDTVITIGGNTITLLDVTFASFADIEAADPGTVIIVS